MAQLYIWLLLGKGRIVLQLAISILPRSIICETKITQPCTELVSYLATRKNRLQTRKRSIQVAIKAIAQLLLASTFLQTNNHGNRRHHREFNGARSYAHAHLTNHHFQPNAPATNVQRLDSPNFTEIHPSIPFSDSAL